MNLTSTFCLVILSVFASGCAGPRPVSESCHEELAAGWAELDLAKADGVDGTISLAKAVGLLTAAKAMEIADDYERCYELAQDARVFIKDSRG